MPELTSQRIIDSKVADYLLRVTASSTKNPKLRDSIIDNIYRTRGLRPPAHIHAITGKG